MKLKIWVLCLLVTMTLYACVEQNRKLSCDELLSEPSTKEINTIFRIDAPTRVNSFELADFIVLKIHNDSNTFIEVAPDRDMKIFWLNEGSWEPIKNGVDYLSAIDRLAPKSSNDPGGTIYDVALTIPNRQDDVRVCIILDAIKDPDGTRSKVAAYTELVLKP
jgi:hypothetical protein